MVYSPVPPEGTQRIPTWIFIAPGAAILAGYLLPLGTAAPRCCPSCPSLCTGYLLLLQRWFGGNMGWHDKISRKIMAYFSESPRTEFSTPLDMNVTFLANTVSVSVHPLPPSPSPGTSIAGTADLGACCELTV